MKIGQIDNEDTLGKRDAFHVPAVLVKANEPLKAGDGLRFTDDTFTMVVRSNVNRHAIVDPFVKKINVGDQFWALLMPDSIGKLNHHFDLNIADVPKTARQIEEEEEYDGCRGCW
jgi:hypothetical protein